MSKDLNNIASFSTLENLPVAVVIFDNNRVYYLNRKAAEILKFPKKKPDLGKLNIFRFILKEFHADIKANNNKIIRGEKFPPVELKIKDAKGNIIDIEAKSNAVIFGGRKVVQSVFHTISERKRQYDELVGSKQILDLVGKNNTDIIFKYDYFPEEKYVYISDSVKTVLGYSPEEFYKDKHFYTKIIHPQDKNKIPSTKKDYTKLKGKNKTKLVRYLTKDKRTVWIETYYSLIKDPKGKIISILGICRNESGLIQKEEELNQKWSNYRELLNVAPIAFFIHQGNCLMCNNEAARILGEKSPKKVEGKFLINYIVAEQRQKAVSRLKEVLHGAEFGFMPYQIKNVKGKIIDIELKSVPVKYQGERCVLTIMQDVSDKVIYAKEKLRAEIAEEHNKKLVKEIELRKKIEGKLVANESELLSQSSKLTAIFESSTHLVWTVNRRFELTSFNKNYYNTILKKYKIKAKLNEPLHKSLAKEDQKAFKDYWHPLYLQALAGKKMKFEKLDKEGGGTEVYREVFLNPIYNENEEATEVSCMAHDITENKRNEQQMLDQSSRLKAIFESGGQLMWTVNKNLAFTSFNKNFYNAIFDLYGVYPEVNKDLKRPKKQFSTDEFHFFWNGKYEEALGGKTVEFVTERTNTAGRKIFRQMFLHPIYNQKSEVVEVSCMGIDITEKVLNEQKIVSQAAKLNSIFDGSSHYIWTVDRNFNLTSFNKNYSVLLTKVYGPEPKQGFAIDRGKMLSDEIYINWLNKQYDEAFNGKTLNFEFSLNDTAGNKIHLDVFLNPIYENDKIVEVSGVSHDITEKKMNEERITQSLKEKEVLLKEVHHRVKNNMQVISSILNLQSSYVRDEYALNLLKESQNRIKTMAYIHESLYQNKTFTSINFSEYVSTLTNNILQSYAAATQKVRLVLDIQKVILNLDTSIPAGLIINELVTNSIKHAFPDTNDGIILINLTAKNNNLFLEVADNGKGFPKDVDFKNTNSLGLQLVNTLVEQLNGTIELVENKYKGTSFFINFPM